MAVAPTGTPSTRWRRRRFESESDRPLRPSRRLLLLLLLPLLLLLLPIAVSRVPVAHR
jgi:hypothetical protein